MEGTQSPIDANFNDAVPLGATSQLKMEKFHGCSMADFYVELHATKVDYHHTCPDAFVVTWKGKKFSLVQTHFHSPSEHTINGKNYPMEAHLVHAAEDGQLLVIGVLMDADVQQVVNCAGVASPECNRARFFERLQELGMPQPPYDGRGAEKMGILMEINPYADFVPPMQEEFYHYNGSLTTPGCNPDVVWILNPTPVTIFDHDLRLYRDMINDMPNNRLAVRPYFTGVDTSFVWDSSLGVSNRPVQPLVGPHNPTRKLYKLTRKRYLHVTSSEASSFLTGFASCACVMGVALAIMRWRMKNDQHQWNQKPQMPQMPMLARMPKAGAIALMESPRGGRPISARLSPPPNSARRQPSLERSEVSEPLSEP
jgi:carbonic anhydrase